RSRHLSLSLSSSSSGTSHIPYGPLPRRRHLVSSYSSQLASVRPSRKRCRSPATSLVATTSTPAVLSSVLVDLLPPRKRFRGSPAVSYEDATVETTTELVIPPVHPGQTVEDRLDKHSEMIRGMYEHLLDMPMSRIEETEEELQILRVRMASLKREITSLHARVRVAELSDDSTLVSLGIAWAGLVEIRRQVFIYWMAFGGNTRIEQRRRDLSSDGVRNLATASGRDRLKEDLYSSTWPNKDDEGIEWLDIEEPLDLVHTSEESVYESLIKEMPKCSLNYDFKIKKGDPRNLKIPCMIGYKFMANVYIDVDLPMNIMSLAYYNSIKKNRYEYRGRNFIRLGRVMHVFIGNMSYVIDFTILENIETNIDPSLSHMIFGRPFIKIACLDINRKHELMTFTDETKEITFKTPYKDPDMSELSSEGHDLLSSRVILSEDDYDRGCRKPSDVEEGFYRDTIKLGHEYVTRMNDEGEVTSRPNGKMIVDSIENRPYVRRMIATPGEPDLPVPVPESFHEQTDEELT
nr:protein kinase-like domain, concanavalin A-like lectin/glucanase domain protein [Tanacetum cinerariifolium]